MSFAVLFPGQGSQYVGMGEDLFEARPDLLGSRSDDILGWSLREMCLDGPEDQLTRTERAQPALFALSYALWDSFEGIVGRLPIAAAGHSLGEYTALCAARAISFDEGLRVVAARGRAMAEAADSQNSGMAAVMGADLELVEEVVQRRKDEGGALQVANINAPGQVVVAGGIEDIEWLGEKGRELGIRRVIPLKVAGAFHSSFMEPAASEVRRALESVDFGEPAFDVWANTTARPHVVGDMASLLEKQVTSPVRFSDCLSGMADSGVGAFIHVGPGDVTAGMARRTVPGAEVMVVSTIEEAGQVASALGTMA